MKRAALLLVLFFAGVSFIASEETEIELNQGISKLLKVDNAKKVEVINDAIADATIISNREIMLEGRKEGATAVNITTDTEKHTVVVTVKNPLNTQQMVELDVQILEISNNGNLAIGLDWSALLGRSAADARGIISLLNVKEQNPPAISPSEQVAFGQFDRGAVNAIVDFLVTKNYAKLLTKPKLLAMSGKRAEFLSGGEVPVVTTDKLGNPNVEWKKFGISLEVEPVLEKKNVITAHMRAEVSSLDYANAVQISGGSVMPAVKTRWADTTISVEPDNTVVIAGLIDEEESKMTSGVPLLSGIPGLGEIFKHTQTTTTKTELVIFVTPKIAGNEAGNQI